MIPKSRSQIAGYYMKLARTAYEQWVRAGRPGAPTKESDVTAIARATWRSAAIDQIDLALDAIERNNMYCDDKGVTRMTVWMDECYLMKEDLKWTGAV